jgi:hypothetical protein
MKRTPFQTSTYLEIGTANANTALELGMRLASSKSITETFDLWAAHFQSQGKALAKQHYQLLAIAQSAITTSISPLRAGLQTGR